MTVPGTSAANIVPRPWHREPYVWMVVAIPLCAVVLGVVLLILATVSYDGLVVDDYYKRGLLINRSLARDRAAAQQGIKGAFRLLPEQGRVEVRLDAGQRFRPPETLRLGLFHGTRAGLDQRLQLHRTRADTYAGELSELASGNWHVHVEANDWRLLGRFNRPRDDYVDLTGASP